MKYTIEISDETYQQYKQRQPVEILETIIHNTVLTELNFGVSCGPQTVVVKKEQQV